MIHHEMANTLVQVVDASCRLTIVCFFFIFFFIYFFSIAGSEMYNGTADVWSGFCTLVCAISGDPPWCRRLKGVPVKIFIVSMRVLAAALPNFAKMLNHFSPVYISCKWECVKWMLSSQIGSQQLNFAQLTCEYRCKRKGHKGLVTRGNVYRQLGATNCSACYMTSLVALLKNLFMLWLVSLVIIRTRHHQSVGGAVSCYGHWLADCVLPWGMRWSRLHNIIQFFMICATDWECSAPAGRCSYQCRS